MSSTRFARHVKSSLQEVSPTPPEASALHCPRLRQADCKVHPQWGGPEAVAIVTLLSGMYKISSLIKIDM